MSIKDLFNKNYVNKVVSSKSLNKLGIDAESAANIAASRKKAQEFVPPIDFSTASNFAIYGSAEKYYTDAITRISFEFPYDGSEAEMNEFTLSSSYLDRHVFDNEYPRATGYAILSAEGWGTPVATLRAASQYYGAPATASYEYISFTGGPHTDRDTTEPLFTAFTGSTLSNIYDPAKGRGNNLALNPTSGSTVEFWLKKTAFNTSNTYKEVIFDVWNGITDDSAADYGRFTLEMSASGPGDSGQDVFLLTYLSGTDGITRQPIGSTDVTTSSVADDAWSHYAVSLGSSSADGLVGRLYVNGALDDTSAFSGIAALNEITGALQGQIGALRTTPAGTDTYPVRGWGKLSASLDEVRYWKTVRTSEEVGRNWWTQVRGGTNSDDANTALGVYYKFNEGITGESGIDSTVLDYSGRITNGAWAGYNSESRNLGSAIVSASAAAAEYKDPIIYEQNSLVKDARNRLKLSGSLYDNENNSSIYHNLPAWIIQSDENSAGDLKNLTQIIASYFDKLQNQIKEVPRLRATQYLSASDKPYPFSSHLVESAGLFATDIFVDADILETVMARDEDRDFVLDLEHIKNRIYQNIYNNLVYIYKSKGTEKAFRNLIHCYGVGEDLIRLNTYGNNITYELKDNFRVSTLAKNVVDFANSDRFNATVYQYTASLNPNSVSFISGAAGDVDPAVSDYIPITLESEILFPPLFNLCCGATGSHQAKFITSSLFGMHSADAYEPYETTWPTNDYADLRVVAVKDDPTQVDAKFKLISSVSGIPILTSSLFKDVYDNTKWNFAVRVVNEKYPIGDFVTGSSLSGAFGSATATPYRVEFYGVDSELGVIRNEFSLTGTLTNQDALNLIRSPKRVFAGAHRTNFTGSTILQPSDVKLSYLRYWTNYLSDETMQAHARDSEAYGPLSPFRNAFVTQNSLTGTYLPEDATLALNWSFYDVTGSDSAGRFVVSDYSSGSAELQSRYHWLGKVVEAQHTGRGDFFPASENASVDKEYLPVAKQALPEIVQSSEMVQILSSDDESFTRDQRPINYYFSVEKSMYQVISDEIINMFGTIREFNRLVGDPVNRYRQEYKLMEKARDIFFEKVDNAPNLDKFIEFYKWIDSSLTTFLMQLVPASAASSDTVRNVVESHILERNKYWTKFPTMEGMNLAPEGITAASSHGIEDTRPPGEELGACERTYANTLGVTIAGRGTCPEGHSRSPGWDIANTLDPSDAFTVSAWITSSAQSAPRYLFNIGSMNAGADHSIWVNSDEGLEFNIEFDGTPNSADFVSTAAIISSDAPYHIVVAFDDSGDDPNVYVNGSSVAGSFTAGGGSLRTIATPSSIGVLNGVGGLAGHQWGSDFRGTFSDVSYWEKKLSVAEIAELRQTDGGGFNAGPADLTSHSAYSDLVSWWRFGNGDGDTTYTADDQVSSNNAVASYCEEKFMGSITLDSDTLAVQGGGTYTGDCAGEVPALDESIHQPYWQQFAPRDEAPLATGDAILDEQRELLRDVMYSTAQTQQLVSMHTYADFQAFSPPRQIYGGINYPPIKNRDIMVPLVASNSSVDGSGNAQNVLEAQDTSVIQPRDITSSAPPELQKKYYAFGFTSLRDPSLSFRGDFVAPFGLVKRDVTTGYNKRVATNFISGATIVNLHSDTTSDSNQIPMQGPFTYQHVGGRQTRHVDVNRYKSTNSTANSIDNYTTRAEAWQLLLGNQYSTTDNHIIALAPADYPGASEGAYPSVIRQKAERYRNVRAKRPVNVRNIKHTTASVNLGNYDKEYQIIQTGGRSVNNAYFVSASGAPLPPLFINSLKTTTNPNSLVAVGTSSLSGNYFGTAPGSISNFFESTTNYSVERSGNKVKNSAVIVNRFSAPGAPEVQSLGYLDIMAKEKSVYNAMPFRNLTVRSSGSGEAGTIRAKDQLGHRRGQSNLLSLHAGQFGYDPTYGSVPTLTYITQPAYQKNNRNTRKRIEFAGVTGYAQYATTQTGSVYDNAYANYSIPRSDLQYAWITASYETSRILGHAWSDSYVSMSSGVYQAIDFVSASNISFSGSIKIDFAGMNTLVVDPIDTVTNILSSSTNTYINNDFNFSLSGSEVLHGLLLHRNGPYGVNSWTQIRGGSTALARALRRKNLIAYVAKNSYNYPLNVSSSTPAGRYTEFEQFTESPVVSKFSPLIQSVVTNNLNSDGEITQEPLRINSAYANNLSAFSHIQLNNRYNVSERSPQNYDSIKDLYLRSRTEDPSSPVSAFDFLLYRENVYPALINTYSSSIRIRQNYVNTFWRGTRVDRTRENVSRFNGTIPLESVWSLDARSEFLTGTITDKVSDNSAPYRTSVIGGSGILQNLYSQIGNGPGGNVDAPASPYYARRHTETRNIRSVVGPEGIVIPETGSNFTTARMSVRLNPDTQAFGGQALWDAGAQANRAPWYNSYDDYVSQMRLKGKEYSIVPEFRISDHVETYINTHAGDFLVDNLGAFAVTGATEGINDSTESGFYKTYSNSDFLKFFEIVKDDHTPIASPSSLGLRCKGLLKFLPYNGFYPSERTVEMAAMFSSSYGRYLNLTVNDSPLPAATSSQAAMAAFVQPIYCPGILYNTIKSGMAVDYPIMTASMEIYGGINWVSAGTTAGAFGVGSISGSRGEQGAAGRGRFHLRLPFETLLEPENYMKDIDICNNETHASSSMNCTASWDGSGGPLYKMMASNFFAEVPEFFLPEQQFTSLVSAPETQWAPAESGKVYAARVKIRKSYNNVTIRTGSLGYRNPLTPLDQWRTDLHETFTMYSRPSAFGPNVGAQIVEGSFGGFNPCFTPPYYYGESWADIYFTAPSAGTFGIDDLLSPENMAVSYIRIGDSWALSGTADPDPGWSVVDTLLHGANIEYNSMQLDAALNLFGKAQMKTVTYDPEGRPIHVEDSSTDNVWVMQTKFETPMLNFADVSVTNPTYGSGSVARGMWHQYGVQPDSPDKGIFFSVSDIPASYISGALAGDPAQTGSLVDLVGMPTTERRLGETAASKLIREAVVAVPYIEEASERSFFNIAREDVQSALSGDLGEDNSIQQMVNAMQRYVFPPKMDFIKNPDSVTPLAMYIFEFEHVLDRDDLTDIWQGLLPKIGYAFDNESSAFTAGKGAPSSQIKKEVSIAHPLLTSELLTSEAFNNKVRWMVFKVKQAANKNYFSKVIKDQINANNNFDKGRAAQIGREDSTRVTEPKYSYNWPYDFFSLVELVKIDAEVEISNDDSDE